MRVTAPRRNRGHFSLAIVAALFVALLVGAIVATRFPWHPPGRYAYAEANRARQLREIALPLLPGACEPAPSPTLRVVVTPTGIDLDHIAVVASWRPDDREAELARLDEAWAETVPFAWFGLVPVVGGAVPAEHRRDDVRARLLPRLNERLADVRRLEEIYASPWGGSVPAEATVYASRGLPRKPRVRRALRARPGGLHDLLPRRARRAR